MISVIDDFLSQITFNKIQDNLKNDEFRIVTVGEKSFNIINTPDYVVPLVQLEGYDTILTFIRKAHAHFDTDPRIHADNIINGHKSDLASVLYLNLKEGVTENGTQFFEHHTYGHNLPEDISNEDFDRLLIEDSNNPDLWKKTDFISSKPNRFLIYDSNYFHSKYPFKIEKGERIVLVTFYKKHEG